MSDGNGFDPREHLRKLTRKQKRGDAWVEVETEYLDVQWRVAWFRSEHPDGVIDSKLHHLDDRIAVVFAVASIPKGGAATGHGSCLVEASERISGRYVEKAETAAVGRALAMLGYGTQFAVDAFEEADEGSDSGVERPRSVPPPPKQEQRPPPPQSGDSGERLIKAKVNGSCSECGWTIVVGEQALWNPDNRGVVRHPQGACREAPAMQHPDEQP